MTNLFRCFVAALISVALLSTTTAFAYAPATNHQTNKPSSPASPSGQDARSSESQEWRIVTPIGQYGGKVTCVAVSAQGTLAYVGLGQRLAVLDISNPTLVTTVGETPLLLNQPFDLAVQGNYVYITMYAAFQQGGLAIVDVSNPSSPVVAGVTSALNSPQGLAVAGAYAYVVDISSGLTIVDISQPAQPQVISVVALPSGYARDVAVAGNYAYVAAYDFLRVIDISNPLRPREVGSLATVAASRVAVSGTTVYVTEWNGGLRVVDVTKPAAPREISTALTDTAPWDVTIDGSYAYAADNSGLHILDVSNPAGPIRMGYYSIPRVDGPAPIALRVAAANAKAFLVGRDGSLRILNVAGLRTIGEIGRVGTNIRTGGVALVDSLAYVAAAETGLQIIDVSNPSNPIEIGHIDTPGRAWDVAVAGRYAYVADGRTDSGHSSGLRIIDVSSPQHPVEVGSIVTPGEPLGVTFFNHLVYVADGEEGGLRIIDVATPSHPQELGFLDTPGQANDVAVVARGAAIYAYLADVIAGVRVINVTDPAHPIDVGQVPQAPGGEWSSVAVRGDYVFASDSYWEWAGLYVIDVRNPVAPRIVAYAPARKASGIALVGHFAYVGGADYFPSPTIPPGGMFKFDISNAAQPRLVGAFDLPAPVTGIASDGTLAYLAVYGPGLVVADTSGATTAVESRVIESAKIADVAVASNSAYVTGDRGLGVLDVSNPANPVMRGRYDTVGRTLSVVVAGNIAYVTESEHLDRNLNAYVGGGLHIVDLQDPQLPVGLGFYEESRLGDGLATQGRYAYIVSPDVLEIIDCLDPAHPTPVGSVDGSFGAIAADGSYVYAVSNYGLAVISVADPTTPAQVGFLPLNATITSVAKSGSFVYVMSYAGLFAIDVSNPLAPTQVGLYEGARDGSIEANGPLVTINAGSVQIVDFSNPTTPRVVGNFAGYASDWPKAGASVTKENLVYRPANRDGLMIMRSRQATHARFLPVAPHNR